jgi:hypothetical protein
MCAFKVLYHKSFSVISETKKNILLNSIKYLNHTTKIYYNHSILLLSLLLFETFNTFTISKKYICFQPMTILITAIFVKRKKIGHFAWLEHFCDFTARLIMKSQIIISLIIVSSDCSISLLYDLNIWLSLAKCFSLSPK